MKLVLLDIDGTLTRTNAVDGRCFEQALADSFNLSDINTDWASYSNTTDSAIFADLFQERFGRRPAPKEVLEFRGCFVRLLEDSLATNPAEFSEIPGAFDMLARLSQDSNWAIAFATGGWPESAALKLQALNISLSDYAYASAEDGYSREAIIQSAMNRALSRYRQTRFERAVSVGDAIWDLKTAANLKLEFIGITGNGTAGALRQAGAQSVLADFRDYEAFLKFLNQPVSAGGASIIGAG